jgi:hypothetical protein
LGCDEKGVALARHSLRVSILKSLGLLVMGLIEEILRRLEKSSEIFLADYEQ